MPSTALLLPFFMLLGCAPKTPQASEEAKPPAEARSEAKQASISQGANVAEIQQRTGIEFVPIPAGSFMMGSSKFDNTAPIHRVELDKFNMSKTEVTVGQYEAYCKTTGKAMPVAPGFNSGWLRKDHPIVNVSWDDAKGYCDWAGVSLPTEAEWEYAARGGVAGKEYPWGDEWDANKCANSVGVNKLTGTLAVGSYPANGYGLCDMSGNVWEWCLDWYDGGYYAKSPTKNPQNSFTSKGRTLRGGSWSGSGPVSFLCASRLDLNPVVKGANLGVRVVFRGMR